MGDDLFVFVGLTKIYPNQNKSPVTTVPDLTQERTGTATHNDRSEGV